ncbi:MAG: carbohydrate kinase family protein [Nitrososphaeria archaeon]|nr:carbohydrate kinase family protein [Conexivisphaerales archaeon]
MKVVVIGDLAIDIRGNLNDVIKPGKNLILKNVKEHVGGVAGNITYYLRMLKDQVTVVGSVGNDVWGSKIIDRLRLLGADVSKIKTFDGIPTGFLVIILDQNRERTMIGSRGSNEKLSVTAEELSSIKPDWIHISGYTLLNRKGKEILRNAQKAATTLGIHYSVDLEGIGSKNVSLSLPSAVVFCNEGSCSEKSRKDASITVIKASSNGCYRLYNGEVVQHRTLKVKVKDTTAAGDAFNAAFIHAYWKTKSVDVACEFANRIAAFKVTKNGNMVKIPLDLLKEFDVL